MFEKFLKTIDYSLPLLIIKEDKYVFIRKNNILKEIVSNKEIELNFIPERIFENENNVNLIRDYKNYNPYLMKSINNISLLDSKLELGIDYSFDYPFYIGSISKDIFSLPTYFVKNLIDNKLYWSSNDLINLKLINGSIFSENIEQTHLKSHQKESGKILWQLDISKTHLNQQIARLLGISHNILVISLSNDILLGVNIKTGKIIWEKKGITKGILIDKNEAFFHQFMVAYVSFNIETGEIVKNFKEHNYFEEVGIETQRDNYIKVGKHLITTDHRKGVIGAFNTETFQFDWVHKEPGVSFPGGSPIVYKAPYLFVQDNNQTLHIFKHTNPIS